MFAEHAQCFKLVETHVRSRYLENVVIEDYRTLHRFLLFLVKIAVHYGEHVGITEHLFALFAVAAVVHKRLFVIVPEIRQQLLAQLIGHVCVFVGALVVTDKRCNGGYGLK